eukprot:493754-Rhodomonas_salina.1
MASQVSAGEGMQMPKADSRLTWAHWTWLLNGLHADLWTWCEHPRYAGEYRTSWWRSGCIGRWTPWLHDMPVAVHELQVAPPGSGRPYARSRRCGENA